MNMKANLPPIRLRTSRRELPSLVFRRGLATWVLTVLLLPGCGRGHWRDTITGSGRIVTVTLALAGFSKVAVGSTFQVTITRTNQHHVVATVDDNLVQYLDVTQSGQTLSIRLKPDVSVRHATLKVDVAMPDLIGLHLGGASRTTLTGFSSDQPLEAEVDGASTVRGEIKSGDAQFRAAGASTIEFQGEAQTLRVEAAGASHVSLDRFTSKDTVVEASGASHVTVNASGKLEARARGASSVRYVGTPAGVSSHATGSSSVRRIE